MVTNIFKICQYAVSIFGVMQSNKSTGLLATEEMHCPPLNTGNYSPADNFFSHIHS
jgi:hypothetical protein